MKSNLKILNLEDNPADAGLNYHRLARQWPECDLVRVDNHADYVTALKQRDFDLILADYSLPDMSGSLSLKLASDMCPEIPFIYVSGTIGEDLAVEALKNGATDYVLKHNPQRLITAVERALREVQVRAEHARAEEAMRESEYKYRMLFESLSDSALLVDRGTHKIIDANQSAQILTGCDRGRIVGRNLVEFVPREKLNGPGDFDGQLIRPNGTVMKIHMHCAQMKLYGRVFFLLLCREHSR